MTDAAHEKTAPPSPDAAPAITGESALRRFMDTRLGAAFAVISTLALLGVRDIRRLPWRDE